MGYLLLCEKNRHAHRKKIGDSTPSPHHFQQLPGQTVQILGIYLVLPRVIA